MRYPLLLLALVPAGVHAGESEIIVTGRALPDARGDAAYSSVIIDRDRLTSVASGRTEDVLRDVAGLQQFGRFQMADWGLFRWQFPHEIRQYC